MVVLGNKCGSCKNCYTSTAQMSEKGFILFKPLHSPCPVLSHSGGKMSTTAAADKFLSTSKQSKVEEVDASRPCRTLSGIKQVKHITLVELLGFCFTLFHFTHLLLLQKQAVLKATLSELLFHFFSTSMKLEWCKKHSMSKNVS